MIGTSFPQAAVLPPEAAPKMLLSHYNDLAVPCLQLAEQKAVSSDMPAAAA